jgi:hypothetical protein
MTTINLEEDLVTALEIIATRKFTTVETLIKEVLLQYLQSEEVPAPPKKYSFVGIWHSGDSNLSTRVDEVLAEGANQHKGWSLPE